MIDILGPIFCSAVVAELVPESWLEPIEAFDFGTSGATGFWQNGGQTRCTSARTPVRIPGECSLAA
jgi:hypothetical protein